MLFLYNLFHSHLHSEHICLWSFIEVKIIKILKCGHRDNENTVLMTVVLSYLFFCS